MIRRIFFAAAAAAVGLYDACHELVWPHLTTVRQPLYEMGQHAVRTCVTAIRNGQQPALPIELATTLVIRNSTARRAW